MDKYFQAANEKKLILRIEIFNPWINFLGDTNFHYTGPDIRNTDPYRIRTGFEIILLINIIIIWVCLQKGVSSEHVHTRFKTMSDGESSREHIVSSIVKLSESICE